MKDDDELTDNDREDFKRAMEGVAPLKKTPQDQFRAKVKPPKPRRADSRFEINIHSGTPGAIFPEDIAKEDWLSAQDCINFARSGVQQKWLRQLRRGQCPIEAQLDLHQCRVNEALEQIERFIAKCNERQIRWVCLVHGKGHYSADGKPVLKTVLNQWLRKHPGVLGFHSAQPKDGGTGALYVLLKR